MRRAMVLIAIMAFVFSVGAVTANAQASIAFGNGGTGDVGNVTFTGNGDGSASLVLGSCAGTTCTLSGANTSGGTYSVITTLSGLGNNLQVSSGFTSGLNRAVNPNGSTSTFSFDNGSGGMLQGNVTWYTLVTDGKATITGSLDITSSTLTGPLGMLGPGAATVDLATNGYPADLITLFTTNPTGTESATLGSGDVVTPEPNSMLLFGTGLLAVGGILRRRLGLA